VSARPNKRRPITSAEFDRAYYGDPGDEASVRAAADNRNVIASQLRKYAEHLPDGDLRACGLNALWRCLEYYRPEFGQKLTTSLYRFVNWECKRELERKFGRAKNPPRRVRLVDVPARTDRSFDHETDETLAHVRECLERLPPEQAGLIRQHYFEGLTTAAIGRANGWAKETARVRLREALAALRRACLEDLLQLLHKELILEEPAQLVL
jgi:RNA polymerase sigma factor (sigma-70 family)